MSKHHMCCGMTMAPSSGVSPFSGVSPYSGIAPFAGCGFGGSNYWIWFLLIILFFCNGRNCGFNN